MHYKTYKEIFEVRGHHYNTATAMCPLARDMERRKLIELVKLQVGDIVCDVPAGGGYVAEGIFRKFADQVEVVCVEPSKNFSAVINSNFMVINDAIHQISVPDAHFTALLSLSGLHHCTNRNEIFAEWARILTEGGRIAIADVAEDTRTGLFLNEFVDKYCPEGHEGVFFKPGDITCLLKNSGFSEIFEHIYNVPWTFESRSQMAQFCYSLFGLDGVNNDNVLASLDEYLGIEEQDDGTVQLDWQLAYASAIRNNSNVVN